MGKKYGLCLKSFDKLIDKEQDNPDSSEVFQEYLRQEKREIMYKLNKWEHVVRDIKNEPRYSHNFELHEGVDHLLSSFDNFNSSDRTYYLKGMLACGDYWAELKQSADILLSKEKEKTILMNEHPYELSLLSVSMLEFDRAKFYLEKFRQKFLNNWRSVKDFSGSMTKNEIVSDLLRQQELKDFLSATEHYHVDDYEAREDLNRFLDIVKTWLRKRTVTSMENFSSLSDRYNSRSLFNDIIQMRHENSYLVEDYYRNTIMLSLNFARGLLEMG